MWGESCGLMHDIQVQYHRLSLISCKAQLHLTGQVSVVQLQLTHIMHVTERQISPLQAGYRVWGGDVCAL